MAGTSRGKDVPDMDVNKWVMSCDNPTRAKYEADKLWRQGIRSGDHTIIQLQYGYSEHDTDILCGILERWERRAKYFNPNLGF